MDTQPNAETKGEAAAEAKPAQEAGQQDSKAGEAEAPKEMRAVILNGFGGLKSVKIVRRPEPALADGEVLIRVQLCGVSFQDVMVRQGVTEAPPKTPFILGFECAGVVAAVADDVENVKVGDRVVALPDHRAWAELVPVPAKYVYPVPEAMPLQEAAAVTLSYTVAYLLVHDLANITSNHTVLLHSAGGAVGQAVCALLQDIGGVTVVGIASKNKHEDLKSSVTHIIDRSSDVHAEVRKVCPEGVDVVLDSQGGEECNRGYTLLKPLGRYILFGSSSIVTGETKSILSVVKSWWQVDKVSPLRLYEDNRGIIGFNLRRLLHHQPGGHEKVRNVVETVYKLWQSGVVKAHIDSTYALEDVTDAMTKMHDRKNVGKLLLDLSMEPRPRPTTPAKTKKEEKKEDKENEKDKEKDSKDSKEKDSKEDAKTDKEEEVKDAKK
ncbi:synaptic vesicle membrane protein VAT-1 homolog-like [Scylla paramamosain]|uniref:synaptic vesicle membrane protein VAT-1 homolog-like n=1 Tax=Scylla paramamosain TaxID=85552 RepID=UPI00308375F2